MLVKTCFISKRTLKKVFDEPAKNIQKTYKSWKCEKNLLLRNSQAGGRNDAAAAQRAKAALSIFIQPKVKIQAGKTHSRGTESNISKPRKQGTKVKTQEENSDKDYCKTAQQDTTRQRDACLI